MLKGIPSGWRNNRYAPQQTTYLLGEEELVTKYSTHPNQLFDFEVGDNQHHVQLINTQLPHLTFRVDGIQYQATLAQKGNQFFVHLPETGNISLTEKERFPTKENEKVEGGYEAPMPSQIIKILVESGQVVQSGDSLMIISSMKMENTITADKDGTVTEVYATEGQNVEAGFLLLQVE